MKRKVIVEMPSMFAQSFKYIASLINTYFETVPPKAGERFHIHVDRKEEVEELYASLCQNAKISATNGSYSTKAIRFNKVALVLASSHNASESFLTRLRNHTAGQKKSFNGVALLTIHDTSLDSIIGGSQSLNKEGAPLHISKFKKSLKQDINQLTIHESEKIALLAKLFAFNQTIHEDSNAILAYYPFMNVIGHGIINIGDWNELGLFPDQEIQTISNKKNIKDRIVDNHEVFEKIQNSHKYGTPGDDLGKTFIHAGVTELQKESWGDLSYGQVKKWKEDRSKAKPPKYIIQNNLFPIDGLEFWERAEGKTAAAQRKRHIIIFNDKQQDAVSYTLQFDKVVKQAAVKIGQKSSLIAEQQSKEIKITVKDCSQDAQIGQVIYDDQNASGKYIFNIAVVPFSKEILLSHSSTYLVKGQAKNQRIRLNADNVIVFNESGADEERYLIDEDAQLVLTQNTKIVAELSGTLDFDTLKFDLVWDGHKIPFELATDASKPVIISGLNIWKSKRE